MNSILKLTKLKILILRDPLNIGQASATLTQDKNNFGLTCFL